MDIVAESLSANILKARNVTVRGQDVLKWFESKLSASVSFAGVFDDLSAAPVRNGAVAIVGNKDYIYSSTTSAWQEFGDEGQIGTLTQAVRALSDELSCYATSSDLDALAAKVNAANTVLSGKLDNTATAADSAKLGGVDASEYARKTSIPSRLKNDSDTVRIDGEGNIYNAAFIKGGYYILTQGDFTFRLNYTGPASWPGSYGYEREDGRIALVYFSKDGSVVFSGNNLGKLGIVGANPENGDILPDCSYGNSVLQFHPQVTEFPDKPSDRFARMSSLNELAAKVDAANAALEEIV